MTDDTGHRPEASELAFTLLDRVWASGDLGAVFGDRPKAAVPWPAAGRLKNQPPAWRLATPEALALPVHLTEVDPRSLHASQTWVLREHATYYRTGVWELTGFTSADRDKDWNRYPVVVRDHRDRLVIAVGHHRSLVALVEGRPVLARVIGGAPDEAVALVPHVLWGASSRLPHTPCESVDEAVAVALSGGAALCRDRAVADAVVASLRRRAAS
jgi:hypothetical protein